MGLGRCQTANVASAAAATAAASTDAAQRSAAAGVALAAAAAAWIMIRVALAPSMYMGTAQPLSGGSCFMPRLERVQFLYKRANESMCQSQSVSARLHARRMRVYEHETGGYGDEEPRCKST